MKPNIAIERFGWACLAFICVAGALLVLPPDSWDFDLDELVKEVSDPSKRNPKAPAYDEDINTILVLAVLAFGWGAWSSAKKAFAPEGSLTTDASLITESEAEERRAVQLDFDQIMKRRVGAALTDLALSAVLTLAFSYVTDSQFAAMRLGVTVCGLLQIIPCVKFRATLGMLITKVHVRMVDGQPTTTFSILSFLGFLWVPLLLCLSGVDPLVMVGCIWYISVVATVSDAGDRGSHTHLTQTKVVATSEGSLAMWRLAIAWLVAPTVLSIMVYRYMS